MDTKNIVIAFREVRRIWKNGVVYNISTESNKITIKEKSMPKRLTVNDAMVAISALTTTVNGLVVTVNNGFANTSKEIARLDKKFDDLYKNNPDLIK